MSLAVKYRPKDFESMVWQKFVKETLQEAVKENKLVGAYLFCGPRGTGKTSVARIMAKTINCLNPKGGNPCHKCEICESIGDNKLMDIIEIDAASHTGVDNIRDLIERAQFLPNVAKYKVYIIDEVHMLSTGAFNALLKILEEPPKHVKFILATTEIQKIPETILSRCQRYDFKNIGEQDLYDRLKYIAKEEKIKIDDNSLNFIVKNAHGGLRTAITLFEQFVINNEVIFGNIVKNMWVTESSFVNDFLDKLIESDKTVVDDFDKIIEDGKNIKLFFKDLIYTLRDRIIENLKKWQSIMELNEILIIIDETFSKTKNAMDERITLLSGVLKVISRTESSNVIASATKQSSSVIPAKVPVGNTLGGTGIYKNDSDNSIDPRVIPLRAQAHEDDNKVKSEVEWQPKKKEPKPEYEAPEVCDIELDEAFDVFGYDNASVASSEEESKKDSENSSGWKSKKVDFSIEDFIAKVKELWWKWVLTIGIRSSKINFDWQTMHLKTPTKMAFNSFNDTWAKELLLKSLEEMGYTDVKIKVE